MSRTTRRGGLAVLSLATMLAAACTSETSESGNGSPGTDGGSSCPCTVGNAGIHFTLGCGQSQCIDLNGMSIGYQCGTNGATQNPAVCQPGFDAGGSGSSSGGAPTCTPKTCAEQGFTCGTVSDTCGGMAVCPACSTSQYCSEANHCLSHAQNIVIYGDLEGGTFGIDVDKDIPNLAIGLVSNSVVNVVFSGQYVSDVVAVYMAVNEGMGTVTGIDPSLVVWHRVPRATVDAGFSNMVIDCEVPSSSTFPCNPPAQVDAFFSSVLGGTVLYNDCTMGPFTGTMLVSAGGSCM